MTYLQSECSHRRADSSIDSTSVSQLGGNHTDAVRRLNVGGELGLNNPLARLLDDGQERAAVLGLREVLVHLQASIS